MRRRLLLLAALGVCAGCGGATAHPATGGASNANVPTRRTDGKSALAGLDGVLRGDASSACLWLTAGTDKVSVSWPAGYHYDTARGLLLDAAGRVRGQVNAQIHVTGGSRSQSVDRCAVGEETFYADSTTQEPARPRASG